MLENIFSGGTFTRTDTRLSSLKNRFYTAIPGDPQDIMSELKNKGVYRSIRNRPTAIALSRRSQSRILSSACSAWMEDLFNSISAGHRRAFSPPPSSGGCSGAR